MDSVYLDNAATTPCDPDVLNVMQTFLQEEFGNPSSKHRLGVRAAEALEEARGHVARATGAHRERIWFTSGGTEADNLAVQGLARAGQSHGRHVVVGPTEHSAVRDAALSLKDDGFEIEFMRLDDQGGLDLDHAASILREDTVLVAQMQASNEFGTVYPIRQLSEIIRARSPHAAFHVDAVQALGKLDCDLAELGCDSLALSAHKIHAPKGSGALVFAREIPVRPLFFGGGQEGKIRPGTQNPAGIVAFGEAVRISESSRSRCTTKMRELRERLKNGLTRQEGLRVVEPGGPTAEFLPNILSVVMPGVPSEVRLHHLDAHGVMASAGAACQAGAKDINPALAAIGLGVDESRSVLRFSFGRFTTEADVDRGIEAMREVSQELAAVSS